jgi:hypothetical protein
MLGKLRGVCEGDRSVDGLGLRVGSPWNCVRSFGARRQMLGASCWGPVGVVSIELGFQNDSDAIDVSR